MHCMLGIHLRRDDRFEEAHSSGCQCSEWMRQSALEDWRGWTNSSRQLAREEESLWPVVGVWSVESVMWVDAASRRPF